MRSYTVTKYEGENLGPVDWEHEDAKDAPDHWRDAEKNPDSYLYISNTGASFPLLSLVRISAD